MAGTDPRIRIAEALEDLSSEDFSRFTAQMQARREDGLQPERFRTSQVENKTHQQVADLLMNSFSDQAVSVTVWLLRAIGNNRVADDLIRSTSKEETVFDPDTSDSKPNVFRYTFPSSGTFCCRSTGLIFEMKITAELHYKTVQWNEALLRSSGRTPAGPLYALECPEGAVFKLHLPHCEPETAVFSQSQLSVSHLSESKQESVKPVEFIKPEQVTPSHVVIERPTPTPYGLTAPSERNRAIMGQVLLFRTPKTRHMIILHVFVLPINIPVNELMSKLRSTTEYIGAPSGCYKGLVIDQFYSVVCPNANCIQPESAQFSMDFDPNFHPLFQLRFSQETTKAFLKIQKTGDNTEEGELWRCEVDLRDPTCSVPRTHPVLREKLVSLRLTFVQSVSTAVLDQLLDKLVQERCLTFEEVETMRVKSRADKARHLFDTVRSKGSRASNLLIQTHCSLDPRSDLSERMRNILSETQ